MPQSADEPGLIAQRSNATTARLALAQRERAQPGQFQPARHITVQHPISRLISRFRYPQNKHCLPLPHRCSLPACKLSSSRPRATLGSSLVVPAQAAGTCGRPSSVKCVIFRMRPYLELRLDRRRVYHGRPHQGSPVPVGLRSARPATVTTPQ